MADTLEELIAYATDRLKDNTASAKEWIEKPAGSLGRPDHIKAYRAQAAEWAVIMMALASSRPSAVPSRPGKRKRELIL